MTMDLDQPPHRRVIIVDWDKRDTANNWVKQWDPDDGSGTFGGVKLSSDGTSPPSHTACNTTATDAMLNGIEKASGNVPFVSVYSQQSDESISDVWHRALDSEGLLVIRDVGDAP